VSLLLRYCISFLSIEGEVSTIHIEAHCPIGIDVSYKLHLLKLDRVNPNVCKLFELEIEMEQKSNI
jgi:hypothetical protein